MTQQSQSETRWYLFAWATSYVRHKKLLQPASVALVFPLLMLVGCSSSKDNQAPTNDLSSQKTGAENQADLAIHESPDSDSGGLQTASDTSLGTANNTDSLRIPPTVNDSATSTSNPGSDPDATANTNESQAPANDPYGMKNPSETAAEKAFIEPAGTTRLAPDANLWVDGKMGRVIVDGYVALREGPLEMFACPIGTKEHESVVAVLSKSRYVQAALLAVGATQGTPVAFDPEYRPATGQRIAIWVLWKDSEGKIQKSKAQQWVEYTGTNKALDLDWVFGGSSFWTEPETGKEYYQADSGDLICVSNFTTATLDLPVESSATNAALQFSAFTQNIPPRGTPVRIVLIPIPVPSDDPAPPKSDPEIAPEDELVAAPATP